MTFLTMRYVNKRNINIQMKKYRLSRDTKILVLIFISRIITTNAAARAYTKTYARLLPECGVHRDDI
jgi:late competence protein required for DNA uptake (superfamily II DNA/RNA helicase)